MPLNLTTVTRVDGSSYSNENTVTTVADDQVYPSTTSHPVFNWDEVTSRIFRPVTLQGDPSIGTVEIPTNFQEEAFCIECGSSNVFTDGTIAWDAAANQYSVVEACSEWWCCDCDNNGDVIFQHINRRVER